MEQLPVGAVESASDDDVAECSQRWSPGLDAETSASVVDAVTRILGLKRTATPPVSSTP